MPSKNYDCTDQKTCRAAFIRFVSLLSLRVHFAPPAEAFITRLSLIVAFSRGKVCERNHVPRLPFPVPKGAKAGKTGL